MSLLADSKGPDQTARMRRLIWAFAVRICPKKRFRIAWPYVLTVHGIKTAFNHARVFPKDLFPFIYSCFVVSSSSSVYSQLFCCGSFQILRQLVYFPLRKHAYSNILKISLPKTENFQIKTLIFFTFLLKT